MGPGNVELLEERIAQAKPLDRLGRRRRTLIVGHPAQDVLGELLEDLITDAGTGQDRLAVLADARGR